MRISITCLSLLFLLFCGTLQAQTAKDVTVPLTASVSLSPAGITLNWPNPTPANQIIARRTKGQAGNQWITLLNQANSSLNTYTDNTVTIGQTYEYFIVLGTTINAFGYAHVALRAPVTDTRGKVLVFVDSTTADAIGVELVRMKNDMRGDGWVATPYKVGPHSTPESVKAQIIAAYTAEPLAVKAVLLIGDVPIPYSGYSNWDGHLEHRGAWPADSYYGDLNGLWTDNTIDFDSSARAANWNVPGDGKFDQSMIPSAVELQVGRIDFRRLDAAAFGAASTQDLIKRYLDKNHAFRTGAYRVDNKALVDDNFGFFGGEAFAANGYRNAYPLVGEANVQQADFFDDSKTQSWLMGYGCGGGNYVGASGVGSSTDFMTDSVNIVFAGLFGSYFGDWDYESNPFMPAALASRGGILTCSWAGRPHWFNQALASGETIGFCHKETQNAQFNNAFYISLGESGAHTALLGDPTLRAHVVAPPTDVTASGACVGVTLNWTASSETVDGYHVYRSLSNDGPYTRISTNLVTGTTFTDDSPIEDTLFYQVRAIKTQTSPGGGIYLNNSIGPITFLIYGSGVAPTVTIEGGTLTCANASIGLEVTSSTPVAQWAWQGPFGVTSTDTVFVVSTAGNYSVVVTDINGCTATGSILVGQNNIPPVVTIASTNILTCLATTTTLSVSSPSALDNASFQWSNGESTPTITVDQPGNYEVNVNSLDNGCPGSAVFTVNQNIQPPVVNLPAQVAYNCFNPCVSLALSNSSEYTYYINLEEVPAGNPAVFCVPGTSTITAISKQNGCATDHDIEVVADINAPGAGIGGGGELTCQVTTVQLTGSTQGSDVTFLWSGPGINGVNQNQQSPTVSAAGVYTLLVTDNDNGCTSTDSYTVESDGSIPVISVTGGTITCANPDVTLTVTSNFTGSVYAWSGPNGFSSSDEDPTTTIVGSYTVEVTAPNGCSATAAVEVLGDTQVPQFYIPPIPVLNCNVDCVTIELTPLTNGLVIDPITICEAGTTVLTITGANGCTADATLVVTEAPELIVSLEPAFIDYCEGTATFSVVASGGTSPYTYNWTNNSTFSSALFLLDGSAVAVTVTDANGCTWVSDTTILTPPVPLTVTSVITNESGAGSANGAIDLQLAGGIAPFTFLWSNGATTQNISGLAGGTYTVTITGTTTGCTTEASFTVETSTVGTQEAALFESLTLSPNPSTGLSTLFVSLAQQAAVKVEVRDVLGRLVLENPTVRIKDMTLPIDLTQQAAGVYHVTLTVDNQLFVRKLVVVK